jgi:hypothetical protein
MITFDSRTICLYSVTFVLRQTRRQVAYIAALRATATLLVLLDRRIIACCIPAQPVATPQSAPRVAVELR